MVSKKILRSVLLNLVISIFFISINLPAASALDNSTVPETVLVESGTFFMGQNMFGRPYGDIDAISRGAKATQADAFTGATIFKEGPAHRVHMSSYYIGKYEITNEQYAKFIDAGGYDNKTYWLIDSEYNEDADSGWDWKKNYKEIVDWKVVKEGRDCPRFVASYSTGELSGWNLADTPYYKNCAYSNQADTPVLGVSWHEAYAYCKWLSSYTGDNYRMPTEAEWEYAARGPESLIFPWGNEYLTESEMCGAPGSGAKANCLYFLPKENPDDPEDNETEHKETEPVGSYPEGVSFCGAHDMAGNVAERTSDWFRFLHYFDRMREGDVIDPTGPPAATPPFGIAIFPFWVEPCRVIKSKGFNTGAMSNGNYNRFGSSYPLRSSAKMFNVQYGGHYFVGLRVAKDVD